MQFKGGTSSSQASRSPIQPSNQLTIVFAIAILIFDCLQRMGKKLATWRAPGNMYSRVHAVQGETPLYEPTIHIAQVSAVWVHFWKSLQLSIQRQFCQDLKALVVLCSSAVFHGNSGFFQHQTHFCYHEITSTAMYSCTFAPQLVLISHPFFAHLHLLCPLPMSAHLPVASPYLCPFALSKLSSLICRLPLSLALILSCALTCP